MYDFTCQTQCHFKQELIVGVAVITAAISSLITGPIADKFGRRPALLMTAVMSVSGPAILAAAPNKEVLLAGRIVVGFSLGE